MLLRIHLSVQVVLVDVQIADLRARLVHAVEVVGLGVLCRSLCLQALLTILIQWRMKLIERQ